MSSLGKHHQVNGNDQSYFNNRRGGQNPVTVMTTTIACLMAIMASVLLIRISSMQASDSTLWLDTINTMPFITDHDSEVEKWMTGISGADLNVCRSAFDKVRSGEWEDPNHERFLFRKIKSEPQFLISVHNEKYDALRYRHIYNDGNYYEDEVIKRFQYILQENRDAFDYNSNNGLPLVLDVGGNIGYYTLLSAAWRHAVVTFEINPANVIRICESLHLNSLNQFGFSSDVENSMVVRIHQQGVSNVTGQELRVAVQTNPGMTSLERRPKKGQDTGETSARVFSTTTTTLDDFAKERQWLDRSDAVFSIMKIDTEGHEMQILLGAEQFIRSRRVKNVLLEYRRHCREAVNILFDAGYVIVSTGLTDDGRDLTKVMMNKEESIAFLDTETDILNKKSSSDAFIDLWFRLDTLPM